MVPIIPDNIPEDSEFFIVSIFGNSSRFDVDIQFNNVTVFIRGTVYKLCEAITRAFPVDTNGTSKASLNAALSLYC